MNKIVLVLLFLSLCYPPVASSASTSRDKPHNATVKSRVERYHAHSGYVQKGAFAYRENAYRFSRSLRRRGYNVLIVKGITSHKLKVYRVLARREAQRPGRKSPVFHRIHKAKAHSRLKAIAAVRKDIRNQEHARNTAVNRPADKSAAKAGYVADAKSHGGSPLSHASSAKGTDARRGGVILASGGEDQVMPNAGLQEGALVEAQKTYRELFINRKRYFHASLSVDEIYTDNAYATKNNKKSNFSTVITPSVWVALPRVSEEHMVIDQTSNRMPGGLIISKYGPEGLRRFQFHLLYRPTIPSPSSNSPYGNAVSHTAYGDLIYNGNKFSGGVSDTFKKSYDTRGLTVSTKAGEIDRYYSNWLGASAGIDTGNRLRVQFDYSNFLVRYSGKGNDFMDRTDNSYSGYLFYRLQPKTSAFIEYSLIDVAYSSDTSHDSTEHHFMAGIQWDITAKSKGRLKAGYDKKDFSNSSSSASAFIAEAQLSHQFTPRTLLTLTGFRKTDESNVQAYLYGVTDQVDVGLQHILTAKISGLADVLYAHERYMDAVTTEGYPLDLKSNIYQGRLALQYEFQRWLRGSLGYIYTKRESNFPEYNFSSNTIDLQVTGAF